jgi:hypothetical protein
MDYTVFVESYMEKNEKIVFGIVLLAALCALASGIFGTALSLLQTSRTISNVGSVKGIGVGIYWDLACTNQTSSINWGLLEPGSNKTVGIYVRNEGNSVVGLSKTVQNWNPSNVQSFASLNWNYGNQTLGVNQVLQVNLTLIVTSTVSGITNFSFDLTISATG